MALVPKKPIKSDKTFVARLRTHDSVAQFLTRNSQLFTKTIRTLTEESSFACLNKLNELCLNELCRGGILKWIQEGESTSLFDELKD